MGLLMITSLCKAQPGRVGWFTGGAFNKNLPAGKATGKISISKNCIEFASPHGGKQFPLHKLILEKGGAHGRLLFFKHPDEKEWTFYSADPQILKNNFLHQQPDLLRIITGIQRKKIMTRLGFLLLAALLLGTVTLIVQSKDYLVKIIAAKIPPAWETKLGETIFRQIVLGKNIVSDPSVQVDLKKITDALSDGLETKKYNLQFTIVDDPTVNAFSLPGGPIIINSGLIFKAASPEEIAGVLAHEIAHTYGQHGLQMLLGSVGLYLLVDAFVGDVSGLIAVLAENGSYLLTQKFSRDHETEADINGWATLAKANLDPRGMIDFFKKLEAESKQDGIAGQLEKSLDFLGTHPQTSERLANLQKKWDLLQNKNAFEKIDLDFAAFKAKVSGLVGKTDKKL